MELLDLSGFHRWAERQGMGWRHWDAPRFGDADAESPWPWPKPDGHSQRSQLADLIVDAVAAASLGRNTGFYLCPPYGRWSAADDSGCYRIRDAILARIGIPTGFEGVAYFCAEEIDLLAATVFARCFLIDDYRGDASDDAWVYPDHGRLYVHFDDEEITWGMAASKEPLQVFDREIERRGWAWLRDKRRNQWTWPLEGLAD